MEMGELLIKVIYGGKRLLGPLLSSDVIELCVCGRDVASFSRLQA